MIASALADAARRSTPLRSIAAAAGRRGRPHRRCSRPLASALAEQTDWQTEPPRAFRTGAERWRRDVAALAAPSSSARGTTWNARAARIERRRLRGSGCERRPRHPRRRRRRRRHRDPARRRRTGSRRSPRNSRRSPRASGRRRPAVRRVGRRAGGVELPWRRGAAASVAAADDARRPVRSAARRGRGLRGGRAARRAGAAGCGGRLGGRRHASMRRIAARSGAQYPEADLQADARHPRALARLARRSGRAGAGCAVVARRRASTRWRSRAAWALPRAVRHRGRGHRRRDGAAARSRRALSVVTPVALHGPRDRADIAGRRGGADPRRRRRARPSGAVHDARRLAPVRRLRRRHADGRSADARSRSTWAPTSSCTPDERSASYEATLAALRDAGAAKRRRRPRVRSLAGRDGRRALALEGGYDTRTLVSFGSPDRGRRRRSGRSASSLRHTDDPVAALAGGGSRRGRGRAGQLHRRARRRSGVRSARPAAARPRHRLRTPRPRELLDASD